MRAIVRQSTPELLMTASGFIDLMQASAERVNVLALTGKPAALDAIEDETCDRAVEISLRDTLKQLAKRIAKLEADLAIARAQGARR